MLDPVAAARAIGAIAALALAGWAIATTRRDVSIVDALWPLFFLVGAGVYAWHRGGTGARGALVLALCAAWAVRLSAHILVRGHGQPEDRRYRAIRARNEPGFAAKSLYLVFGLQGLLAFVIGLPLYAALTVSTPLHWLDALGIVLWAAGFGLETLADWQLLRFRAVAANADRVLDSGPWRYSRHPNYFGEAVLWWGYFVFAAAAGASWTIVSPLIMTWLLLRVSGVALLERDIHDRRPAYRNYAERTSPFVPRPPQSRAATDSDR